MGLPFIVRNFTIHLDGTPKNGEGEEVTIPTLELQTEEFRGGGMDIPILQDLGMRVQEIRFKMFSFDDQTFTLFGRTPGQLAPLTIRGHLAGENGVTRRVVVNTRTLLTRVEPGSWMAGRRTELSVTGNPHYLKITHGDKVLCEIDPVNAVRIINGVDQLAEMRINLGL